ncbi:MAG: 50S ribosomal protein L29 [Euryarchaeota archaeon]|nr:50S ribosomal protein L29 [Euryarchaeota archaeon]
MALLRSKDIRNMSPQERDEKLESLRNDLMHERGIAAMGGAPSSPGKIRALRTNIARILTIQTEMGKPKEAKK